MDVTKVMKNILVMLITIALSSCISDVSQTSPHENLVGTVWRLKKNSYVVRYFEEEGDLVVPCDFNKSSSIPGEGWNYSEDKIGEKDSVKVIVGGLKAGVNLRINRVIKKSSPEIGDRFDPIAVDDKNNEFRLNVLYQDYEHEGVLNPRYAEPVR